MSSPRSTSTGRSLGPATRWTSCSHWGSGVLPRLIKDGDGQLGTPSCALGSGVVDLPAVLAAATSAAAHIVELEGLGEDEVWSELDRSRHFLVDGGLTTARAS